MPDAWRLRIREEKTRCVQFSDAARFLRRFLGPGPRTMNTIISRLMDAGKAFFCRITTLNEKDPDNPWKDIECKIFMVE